jgi:hypothetical protein
MQNDHKIGISSSWYRNILERRGFCERKTDGIAVTEGPPGTRNGIMNDLKAVLAKKKTRSAGGLLAVGWTRSDRREFDAT